MEKGLEAVFDKFKNAANEDFERYPMIRLSAFQGLERGECPECLKFGFRGFTLCSGFIVVVYVTVLFLKQLRHFQCLMLLFALRYKELEKMRIEKEHAFQREQMKLENQQRKEEREHEMQMLLMMLGNTNQPRNADTFPMPSILNAYPHASVQQQNYGSVSSISTPSYAVHEDKTYFQL